jgi:hypothetical protein
MVIQKEHDTYITVNLYIYKRRLIEHFMYTFDRGPYHSDYSVSIVQQNSYFWLSI